VIPRQRLSPADTIALLEASHDGILVLDLDRQVLHYNTRFLKMFGLSAQAIDRGGIDASAAAVDEQLESGGPLVGRTDRSLADEDADLVDTMRFKDGRVYERHVTPHRVDGRIVGIVASFRDIGQAVRTEQSLEQHRAFLEKAQQVAHIGSWVAELDGSDHLTWSTETHRILGVPLTGARTRAQAMAEFVHPDDRDAVRRMSEAAVRSDQPYDIEHRIVRGDGSIRWVHTRADLLRGEDGKPLRMIGTLQDITDRRELEEQLRQAQKLEAIGRLAGGIAHDLNNALTAIAGYTELSLEALDQNHPARADVLEIRRAAERAESVTRQLLAFSRKQLLEPRVFFLSDSMTNLARMLERLLGNGVDLKTVVAPDVPPIYGDPGQIDQAIINLAVNARDAMPDGGRLTLAVSVVDVDEAFSRAHQPMTPGRYVELAVIDTGVGMDEETQAHVFEPFFTTKEVGKGTGLGLAMVYGTVKQSGGYIFVESEVGRGTSFRLYFHPAPGADCTRGAAGPKDAASARTVLVVEDESSVRNLVVAALKNEKCRVLQAASGFEALKLAAAETGRIDLLLTDASMPGMSGIELANTLLRQRPDIRVIVMSGYVDDSLTLSGASEPVTLLPKPFTPRDVRQKIGEALGLDRLPRP
jgi:PAS domain S-box-containing protein